MIPVRDQVPDGGPRQPFDISSEMPPLMCEVGRMMVGQTAGAGGRLADHLARQVGRVGGDVASAGADLLGGLLGGWAPRSSPRLGGGMRMGAAVEGLQVNSNRGFALVKGLVGFGIFVRLCN